MKTKEQLAEEHVNKRYPKEEWTTYQRNFAEQDYLAGYEARDAQLKELPEFDEKAAENWARTDEADVDSHAEHYAIIRGARWQHSQDAKIIAAKDWCIDEAQKQIGMYEDANRELHEKIRELEKANALIDELEGYCKELKGVVITNWSNGKSIAPGFEALEKIKQYKEGK